MGLMDSLKKATGLGLTAAQLYDRAYEKGVLLGPSHWGEAARMFTAAGQKAQETGEVELVPKAAANGWLYAFLASGRASEVAPLRQSLAGLTELEVPGSRVERMAVAPLLAELDGRLAEAVIATVAPGDHRQRAETHAAAAACFKRIFGAPLLTYRYHGADGHDGTADERYFFHLGMCSWNLATAVLLEEPEKAAEHMARALGSLRQARDEPRAVEAERWLSNCRQRRTCYLCHREVQGSGVHFRHYPADVTAYAAQVVARLGQDVSSIDLVARQVVLCGTCGSVVEQQADLHARARADEVAAALVPRIAGLEAAIQQLATQVQLLAMRR